MGGKGNGGIGMKGGADMDIGGFADPGGALGLLNTGKGGGKKGGGGGVGMNWAGLVDMKFC